MEVQLPGSRCEQIIVLFGCGPSQRFSKISKRTFTSRSSVSVWRRKSSRIDEYLRILKKGILLPHYRPEKFHEKEHKAKDCKLANTHSYKQSCKSSAFFAYDKVSQLEMIDCISTGIADQHILRLEVQLSSKGMKKWLKEDGKSSAWKTISAAQLSLIRSRS